LICHYTVVIESNTLDLHTDYVAHIDNRGTELDGPTHSDLMVRRNSTIQVSWDLIGPEQTVGVVFSFAQPGARTPYGRLTL
jgi:hypothetical protein